jgi:hypothetical protein
MDIGIEVPWVLMLSIIALGLYYLGVRFAVAHLMTGISAHMAYVN